ncbi:MAG: L,D-transpeptidase [Deltaproteobacteria bacterium]|nr:L,D-transpeptidase [Deltaproteobacteria bacterium]
MAWARSASVVEADQPILSAPSGDAPRRGAASRQARLPLYGARPGPGCLGLWLHVGPQAWLCQDGALLSGAAPIGTEARLVAPDPTGLPYAYFFAGPDGSLGYRRIEDVDVGEPRMTLEPGFAVAVVEQRVFAGQIYGRTNRALWVPMRDLFPARPFAFRGEEITETPGGVVPFGWVFVDDAPLYSRRGGAFFRGGRAVARFTRVGWLEQASSFQGVFARIDAASWIDVRSLRHPALAPPPSETSLGPGERWIDVDLASQTLVAYEGERPVYATLVSTGKGQPGSATATPPGAHRIWVKLLSSVMDNIEDEDASRYYRIEDVPYVQYFTKGVGLHAAFWHRSFGRVRSHGCINLAPLDAERLFRFTGPRLPAGWTAALPTAFDRGTVVRVR